MKKFSVLAAAFALSCSVSSFANAGVVNTANVGSQGAFIDTTTGLTWLDLDNFWTTGSYNTVKASLVGTGFHIATLSELLALEASMTGSFAANAMIIGANYSGKPGNGSRDLMWGVYDDGDADSNAGYGYKYAASGWNNYSNQIDQNSSLIGANLVAKDLGAWVVSDGVRATSVPEPASMLLLGAAMMGMFGARLKRNRK